MARVPRTRDPTRMGTHRSAADRSAARDRRLEPPALRPGLAVEARVAERGRSLGGEALEQAPVVGVEAEPFPAEKRQHAKQRSLVDDGNREPGGEPAVAEPLASASPLIRADAGHLA